MDELFRFLDVVTKPIVADMVLKDKSQSTGGLFLGGQMNSKSSSYSSERVSSDAKASTDNPPGENSGIPQLTFQLKCDKDGQLSGVSIHASNSKQDPEESAKDRRNVGLSADLSGPVSAQIAGRVEESSDGFQAHLDFSISDTTQDSQPKCVWTTYDTSQSGQRTDPPTSDQWTDPPTSGGKSLGLDDILGSLFSPQGIPSPSGNGQSQPECSGSLGWKDSPSGPLSPAISRVPDQNDNSSPPTSATCPDGVMNLVDIMETMMGTFIGEGATSQVIEEKIDFNTENSKVEYENQIEYRLDRISGKYHTDVDLIRIDSLIQRKITEEREGLDRKRRRVVDLKVQLSKSTRRSETVSLEQSIQRLVNEIGRIESRKKLRTYQASTKRYLEAYQEMGRHTQVISFGKNSTSTGVDTERLRIIMGYLEIARKYIDINLIHVERSSQQCLICRSSLKGIYPNNSDMIQCPSCQVETHYLQPSPQDNYAANNASKSNYKDRETFIKAIHRYEGKQKTKFPDILMDTLDIYFRSKGYPSRDIAVELKLIGTIEGRRRKKGTSREIMLKALRETSYSTHYEDCSLLCHLTWGSELPDLTMIRDRVLRDYDLSQQIFNRVKGNRKSSLGADYRLFRHLWHLGFPCHPADFKIVTTPAIIKYYEEVWEKVCLEIGNELGWKQFARIEVLEKMDVDTLKISDNFD